MKTRSKITSALFLLLFLIILSCGKDKEHCYDLGSNDSIESVSKTSEVKNI